MAEDGEKLPAPSALDAIMADPEQRHGRLSRHLAGARKPTVRVNITLPERLLRRIDKRAKNRSGFLARAAEKGLAES
jgi:HicB_like antitoxin of bacterial toxin-antitoxin system